MFNKKLTYCLLVCQIGIFNAILATNTDIEDNFNHYSKHKIIINDSNISNEINNFLKSTLNKKDFQNLSQSSLDLSDKKKLCGLIFKKEYDLDNLAPEQLYFLNCLGLNIDILKDVDVNSFNNNAEFRSPKKTMLGKRINITTPQAREIGISRRVIKELSEAQVLTDSRTLRKRRIDFNAEQAKSEQFIKRQKQNQHQQQIDAGLNQGLTRYQSHKQKELLSEFVTINAMKAIVDLHQLNKENGDKTTKSAIAAFFVQKFGASFNRIDIEIPNIFKREKKLNLYYNPKDFNNADFQSTREAALMRLSQGNNPRGFQIHHLTMSQKEDDILIYLPNSLHTPEIHIWHTDISDYDRDDFNRARKSMNLSVYQDIIKN